MPEPIRVSAGSRLKPEYSNGLVGHWKMNVGGVLIPDLSGYNNHGKRTNMANPPTAISGWAGLGDILDGVNDYVRVANNPSLSFGTQNFTLSLWVKRTTSWPDYMWVLDKLGSTGFGRYSIITYQQKMYTSFSDGVNEDNFSNASVLVSADLDQWTYVTFVIDRSSGVTVNAYKNGVYLGSMNVANITGNISNSSILYISSIGGTSHRFPGTLDDVRIKNYAMSADEIAHAYYQQEDEWDLGFDAGDVWSYPLSLKKLLLDSESLSDTFSRKWDSVRSLVDNCSLSDTFSKKWDAIKTIVDSESLSDSKKWDAIKTIVDSESLSDSIQKKTKLLLPKQEYYYWNEVTQEWEIVDQLI